MESGTEVLGMLWGRKKTTNLFLLTSFMRVLLDGGQERHLQLRLLKKGPHRHTHTHAPGNHFLVLPASGDLVLLNPQSPRATREQVPGQPCSTCMLHSASGGGEASCGEAAGLSACMGRWYGRLGSHFTGAQPPLCREPEAGSGLR